MKYNPPQMRFPPRLAIVILALLIWDLRPASAQSYSRCIENGEIDIFSPPRITKSFGNCALPIYPRPRAEAANTDLLPTEETYLVQPGDTLYSIALHFGTNVASLAAVNGLDDPSLIYVGQSLVIPTSSGLVEASPPIISLEVLPPSVAQGHTVLIAVKTEGQALLTGTLDGRPLTFFRSVGQYWAVAGFAPWTAPGAYFLSLRATDLAGQTGSAEGGVLVTASDFPIEYIDLPSDREGLLAPDIVQPELNLVTGIFTQITPQPLWAGSFILPVAFDHIGSVFGERRSYDGGPVASYHLGVDFATDEGVAVYAANSGRVALAQTLNVRGNTVLIDHGLGVFTGYFHLSALAVTEGQEVRKGELIGYVGSTGLATGAHLHWEMRIANIPVDPEEWTVRSFPE